MKEDVAKEYAKDVSKYRTRQKSHFREPIIQNEKTAVKVAEAVLFNIYGEENIKNERPYTIGFADNYWILYGYLPSGYHGGVFTIIIDAENGEVVSLWHDK